MSSNKLLTFSGHLLSSVIFYVAIFNIGLHFVNGTKSTIKIVEEPATYGNNVAGIDLSDQLSARVNPSNFSGPSQFHILVGKCFNWTDDKYRYTLCPFQNITQHELTLRWNLYKGVLGVWEEWEISNNTFSAMVYSSGSECGNIDRQTRVVILCGERNELLNVSEPSKCHYEAAFATPLACHSDALLVYPRLPVDLQNKWDALENDLQFGEVTLAGYEAWLAEIFQEAGYKHEKHAKLEATTKMPNANVDVNHHVADFAECQAELTNFKIEARLLREELLKCKNNSTDG